MRYCFITPVNLSENAKMYILQKTRGKTPDFFSLWEMVTNFGPVYVETAYNRNAARGLFSRLPSARDGEVYAYKTCFLCVW